MGVTVTSLDLLLTAPWLTAPGTLFTAFTAHTLKVYAVPFMILTGGLKPANLSSPLASSAANVWVRVDAPLLGNLSPNEWWACSSSAPRLTS